MGRSQKHKIRWVVFIFAYNVFDVLTEMSLLAGAELFFVFKCYFDL